MDKALCGSNSTSSYTRKKDRLDETLLKPIVVKANQPKHTSSLNSSTMITDGRPKYAQIEKEALPIRSYTIHWR